VPAAVIKERIAILKVAADLTAKAYKEHFLGKRLPILFEAKSKGNKGYWEGYSDNYIKVLFKSKTNLKNKLACVRLKKASDGDVLAS
jgi:threonylcarbamoyladenosine tRNA methylthiotransferase MtaB